MAWPYCVADDEFQLPCLVATLRETCEVIPLHPKVDPANMLTKPLKPMKRGWKKRQLFTRETWQRLKPIHICESSFHGSLLLEKPSQDQKKNTFGMPVKWVSSDTHKGRSLFYKKTPQKSPFCQKCRPDPSGLLVVKSVGLTPLGCFNFRRNTEENAHLVKSVGLTPLGLPQKFFVFPIF